MFTGGMVSPIIYYFGMYAIVTTPVTPGGKPASKRSAKKILIVTSGLVLSISVATMIYIMAFLVIGEIWGLQ